MNYDVIIIGAGPAGYVAAIRAGQVGLRTALIEKKHIGGMCLNWGCVPTKVLIESAKVYDKIKHADEFGVDVNSDQVSFNWEKTLSRTHSIVKKLTSGIEYLLKKNAVEIITGEARINKNHSVTVDNRNITAPHIIIATGSYPSPLPVELPPEVELPLEKLTKTNKIGQNIVLMGHGPHIAELAQFFSLIDKKVTVILNEELIIPDADEYLSNYLEKKLKSQGVKIIRSKKIDNYEKGKIKVQNETVSCDVFINLNRRGAVIPDTEVDLKTTKDGYLFTYDNLETSVPGIYAIGDVNGRSYLAHTASAQGIWLINRIKGIRNELNLYLYPLNIYTIPEIAQIGKSEQQLKKEKIDYKLTEFPLTANAKALAEGNIEGKIRMFSDARFGQVLGVQIIAPNATDMISEASAWMQTEGTIYDIAQTIHAHPTISEIFVEAGFEAIDRAIHK